MELLRSEDDGSDDEDHSVAAAAVVVVVVVVVGTDYLRTGRSCKRSLGDDSVAVCWAAIVAEFVVAVAAAGLDIDCIVAAG